MKLRQLHKDAPLRAQVRAVDPGIVSDSALTALKQRIQNGNDF